MIPVMQFDFETVTAPFRMQPGLRRLAADAQQLSPNRVGAPALDAKLAVLSRHASQALLVAPGFDAAPAVVALARHAAVAHPAAFQFSAPSVATASHLGWSVRGGEVVGDGPPLIGDCLRALPPAWRLTGLMCLAFAEDFALLNGADSCIPWLAVCLPSRWAPEQKIGLPFAAVHAPVADNQALLAASAQLVRLVTAGERWERFVWTITPEAGLDNHPLRVSRPTWPDTAQADDQELALRAFFRCERQTFIPLPDLQQAVFTIHVEVVPLQQVLAQPAHAQRLHDALQSMSGAVLDYRGLRPARDRLLTWMQRCAGRATHSAQSLRFFRA